MSLPNTSSSGQTPSIPPASPTAITTTPGVTGKGGNAAATHIIQDPCPVKKARIQKEHNVPLQNLAEKNVPLKVYQSRRLRGNKKEQAAAATNEDPLARPNTSTLPKVVIDPVESVVPELDLINQNTPKASKEIFTRRGMPTELEQRVAILEKELTAKTDELQTKVKSVEEAADRRIQMQQEKIDTLTAEKALVTQDLEGKLKAVSHELEQQKKLLEKERTQISQFEIEKKKIAVLADVTATYNLLLSFVVAVPEFDYTLLGDDVAQKVQEIRLKLAKEEAKCAVRGGEGQVDSRSS